MNDESDIGLIDSHTEAYRSEYDLNLIFLKLDEGGLSLLLRHFGVEYLTALVYLLDLLEQLFTKDYCLAVDNSRMAVSLPNYIQKFIS